MYSVNFSLSLRVKKNMKRTTNVFNKIVGKFVIMFANPVIIELVVLVTKEEIVEPIWSENKSEEKTEGNIFFKGVTKSIPCEFTKICTDWSTKTGVKNQRGIKINNSNNIRTMVAARFLFFIFEFIFEYIGLKIKAKIIPVMIANKIGFNKKKDNTINTAKIKVEVMCLQ